MKLFIMRHAESNANVDKILASHLDVPLSTQGVQDANSLAEMFSKIFTPDFIYCSPLIRAIQTARPFAQRLQLPLFLDDRLIEHDLGIFTGKTYVEAESEPGYEKRREERWDWLPVGGESYCMIAARVTAFLDSLETSDKACLIVTHAVTMRILRGVLEVTLPRYPLEIAKNGEIWEVNFIKTGIVHEIMTLSTLDGFYREHRA